MANKKEIDGMKTADPLPMPGSEEAKAKEAKVD